jgi:hypothetical protein
MIKAKKFPKLRRNKFFFFDSRVVGFDIRVETVTRVQQKPKAMYTFLCGQVELVFKDFQEV